MSDHPDEQMPDSRQQRLDALRGLARDAMPLVPDASSVTTSAAPSLPVARPLPPRWRRWVALVSACVIVLLVIGVVVGAILRQGAPGSHTAPALVSKAYSLAPLSCPSTPAWSPDGKTLALLVTPQANLSGCHALNIVTDIARTDASGSSDSTSGPPPDVFAIAIVDAATGHVTRTITLPALSQTVLCAGSDPCSITTVSPISVSWSPDGHSVAAFFDYTYFFSDNIHAQERGALIVARADGSGVPRLLIADGRVRANQTPNDYKLGLIWSAPRFTWNLTTGAGSYSDIHMGLSFTTRFAPGYRLAADGALSLEQQTRAGDLSPWDEGALLDTQVSGVPTPVYSYQVSQWLWSADGRYVTPNLDTAAYITFPGVTGAPPPDIPRIVNEPSVSPPDAATSQSMQAAARQSVSAALARSPDGKLLATYMCGVSAGELTIRAVASGATLAQTNYTYPLTSNSLGCSGDIGAITWSPDGARIASVDAPEGQIIIWQVNLHA